MEHILLFFIYAFSTYNTYVRTVVWLFEAACNQIRDLIAVLI
jgi:hypothetical protein